KRRACARRHARRLGLDAARTVAARPAVRGSHDGGDQAVHSARDSVVFRRITRKLGKAQAITATAHKLARIVFHLLNTKEAYNDSVFRRCEEEALKHAELRLRKHAARMGFQLVSAANG